MIKVFLGLISVVFLLVSCSDKEKSELISNNKVKIGVYDGEASLLIFIAKQNDYFKIEGLEVELVKYKTGRDAMKAMLNKEVDYSNATEYVAVKNSFENDEFKILTSIAKANINGMLLKTSSGIKSGKDIKNRVVGTTFGTASEFYTGVFLKQNGLKSKDVVLKNVEPKDRIKAFDEDSVDVLFGWEPYIYKILKKYGDKAIYLPMPIGSEFDFIFSVNNDFHKQNRHISQKIVKALKKANEDIHKRPELIATYLKRTFDYNEEYINYSQKKYNFDLLLPYSLLVNMKLQSNFLQNNNLVEKKSFDPKKIIDLEILKNIDINSVNIWKE